MQTLMKCIIMQHFIWVLTVCRNTYLGVSSIYKGLTWMLSYQTMTLCKKSTVKPVLSGHSKKDKTKVLMANGSLMQVKRIAECSPLEHSAILLTCIKQ